MSDKRSTQIAFPLGLEPTEPTFKDHVKQHWQVTFSKQPRVSVCAKRIMALVLAQIKESEWQFKPFYQMHISKVVSPDKDIASAYKEVKKAFEELSTQVWKFEDLETHKLVPRHLLDTTKIKEIDGYQTSYDNGLITIALNPALKDYFLQLAHYSTYEIKDYLGFKSWYSMRLFELLSAFQDNGVWQVSIEEFRLLMDCKDKYKEVKNLIDSTLFEPQIELKSTKLAFTYQTIFDNTKLGRGRKPIVALLFKFPKTQKRTIPESWWGFSDELTDVLLKLKQFKVSEHYIVTYARAIGVTGLRKLLREWQIKEASNDRINNRELYCNKVFVEVGQKYLATKTGK